MRWIWTAQFVLGAVAAIVGFRIEEAPPHALAFVGIGGCIMTIACIQFWWTDEVRPVQDLAFAQRILGIRDTIIDALRGVPNVTDAEKAARELTNIAGEIAPELKTAHAVYREPAATTLPPTRRARRRMHAR